jgi:hypothetical protein
MPNDRCYANIRDHFINEKDPGEKKITIIKIYPAPTKKSDLVIAELAQPIVLDDKAQVIPVSPVALQPGDIVTTAGWGFTGPNTQLSNVLVRTDDLEVSVGGGNETIKTKVGLTRDGTPVDPCSGDSGGPLVSWSDAKQGFVLHATLEGAGYDCRLDTTNGDGRWNSVMPHLVWIESVLNGKTSMI